MDTVTIVVCVVALILGMLIANMLKGVCGCKVIEGHARRNEEETINAATAVLAIARRCCGIDCLYTDESTEEAASAIEAARATRAGPSCEDQLAEAAALAESECDIRVETAASGYLSHNCDCGPIVKYGRFTQESKNHAGSNFICYADNDDTILYHGTIHPAAAENTLYSPHTVCRVHYYTNQELGSIEEEEDR